MTYRSERRQLLRLAKLSLLGFMIFAGPSEAIGVPLTERLFVARAMAEGRDSLPLLLAARQGQERELEQSLAALGVDIAYRAPEVGYYRVRVPLDRIQQITSLPSVQVSSLAINESYLAQPARAEPDSISVSTGAGVGPGQKRLSVEEYLSRYRSWEAQDDIGLMGIPRLRSRMANLDGQGVTVAVIEFYMDPFLPYFVAGADPEGRPRSRVREIYSAYNEVEGDLEGSMPVQGLVRMAAVPASSDRAFQVAGRRILLPDGDDLRIGFLDETRTVLGNRDLNEDGNPVDQPRTFAVVQDRAGCIWVDTNQDDDLRDERCMKFYNDGGGTGRFRRDGAEVGPNFYLAPLLNGDDIAVAIADDHSVSVGAIIAGSTRWGDELEGISGAVPGAELISIGHVGRADSAIEAVIFAARHPRVDVINLMLSPGMTALNDGSRLYSVIMDRIVERFGKPVIGPAGNQYQQLNSVTEGGTPRNVLTAGQFFPSRVASALTGQQLGNYPGLWSSAGPTLDGQIKPDVLATSLILTPFPSYAPTGNRYEFLCPNLEPDPRVTCFSGTSAAGPSAAGAVALLVAAARRAGLQFDALEILSAIRASARFLPGESAHVQGRGVIDVNAAFDYLTRQQGAGELVRIDVEGTTQTGLDNQLAGRPVGLFDREGWSPGASGERVIHLTRRMGGRGDRRYRVELVGNDHDTFRATNEISLPLDLSVPLPVQVNSVRPGVNAAILRLRDETTDLIVADIALTVIAAVDLPDHQQRPMVLRGQQLDNRALSFFVRVPENTIALRVRHMHTPNRFVRFIGPMGWSMRQDYFNWRGRVDGVPRLTSYEPEETFENAVYRPAAGVWELVVNERVEAAKPYDIALEVDVVTEAELGAALPAGSSTAALEPRGWRMVEGDLRSGRIQSSRNRLPHLVELSVPDGARRIEVRSRGGASPVSESLPQTITAFACDDHCYVADAVIGRESASLLINRPVAARWFVSFDSTAPLDVNLDYEIFVTVDEQVLSGAPAACSSASAETEQVRVAEMFDRRYSQATYGVAMADQIPVLQISDLAPVPLVRREVRCLAAP